jgi:hypothetical protein
VPIIAPAPSAAAAPRGTPRAEGDAGRGFDGDGDPVDGDEDDANGRGDPDDEEGDDEGSGIGEVRTGPGEAGGRNGTSIVSVLPSASSFEPAVIAARVGTDASPTRSATVST